MSPNYEWNNMLSGVQAAIAATRQAECMEVAEKRAFWPSSPRTTPPTSPSLTSFAPSTTRSPKRARQHSSNASRSTRNGCDGYWIFTAIANRKENP